MESGSSPSMDIVPKSILWINSKRQGMVSFSILFCRVSEGKS